MYDWPTALPSQPAEDLINIQVMQVLHARFNPMQTGPLKCNASILFILNFKHTLERFFLVVSSQLCTR